MSDTQDKLEAFEKIFIFIEKRNGNIQKVQQFKTIQHFIEEDREGLIQLLRDRIKWYTKILESIEINKCIYREYCYKYGYRCGDKNLPCLIKDTLDSFHVEETLLEGGE